MGLGRQVEELSLAENTSRSSAGCSGSRCAGSQDHQGPSLSGEKLKVLVTLQRRWWVSQKGKCWGIARQHGSHLILKGTEFRVLITLLQLLLRV